MGFDKRLLVTGAGGQVGRAFGRLQPDALLLDRKALDVTDRDEVMAAVVRNRPEVIVHAAAQTNVDEAEVDPETAQAVNVEGTRALASAAEEVKALLVYLSTDYVFDGTKIGEYSETDPPNPLSVYGKGKLDGEVAAAGGRHLIVRTSWVFGEGKNFIRSILAAAKKQQDLAVISDQKSRPTYALDLAKGILDLLIAGASGLYHLAGGGVPASRADLSEVALAAAGLEARVRRTSTAEYYAERPERVAPRPANSALDCSKAALLGVALRPWPEAVMEYVKKRMYQA